MPAPKPTILVVDDDPHIREVVSRYLRRDDYPVVAAADGQEALRLNRLHQPGLVVLDLMLPALSGVEVCRRIQGERRVPVIMLTAKGDEEDRIIGLGLGADDYVVKPFSPRELVARVTAVLRRATEVPAGDRDPQARSAMITGGLTIIPAAREVLVEGEPVSLTVREFDLLAFFASHPGRVFTRDQLMDAVWGYTFAADLSTVTVHVRRLREKIEADPANPQYLLTVWGVGYRFSGDLARSAP